MPKWRKSFEALLAVRGFRLEGPPPVYGSRIPFQVRRTLRESLQEY